MLSTSNCNESFWLNLQLKIEEHFSQHDKVTWEKIYKNVLYSPYTKKNWDCVGESGILFNLK